MKEFWQDDVIINGWLSIANSFSAEIMANQEWDSICIDAQHGMLEFNDAFSMIQAISTTKTIPLVRIPYLRPELIGKYLDTGVAGLICPMINTKQDAENLVKWSKYPPHGERSFGTCRALFSNKDYFSDANNKTFCLAMIETRTAVNNLEQICSVEELDGLYIGPADLSCDFGYKPAFDREEQEMIDIIKQIISIAKKHNKRIGLHTASAAYAKKATDWGVDLVTVSSDVGLLVKATKEVLTEVRKS